MKTTGLILAAVAATAAAETFEFNIREVETNHVHAEYGELGYRCAQSGTDSAEVSFYQVSTGESLFQASSTETVHVMQYLNNAPLTVKNQGGDKKESFAEMKASGTMQARIAGHEALHAHPIFAKFIAPLSRALGENGVQGNTHPAAVYVHHTAMASEKREANQGAHSLGKAGQQGVPTNLNSMSKGDAFTFDSTAESFIQELAADEAEWGGVAGVANGIWNGITGLVNGIIGGITTVWDAVTTFVSKVWQFVSSYITRLIGGLFASLIMLPVGIVAKAVWWEVMGGGRRRRRRRYRIGWSAAHYRPFFDNRNYLWSRVARCMDGLAMPSGSSGSPCFGICGPSCYCFIWHCGSCIRDFRACWEHDCACTKDCAQNNYSGRGNPTGGTVAWEAYICWLFTANYTTCWGPGCTASYCAGGNNANSDAMSERSYDEGDCKYMSRDINELSGAAGGAFQYFVVGVNFPKNGPGGIFCFIYANHGSQGYYPTPQKAWYGGGRTTRPGDGQAGMCHTTLGKTAMISTHVTNYRNRESRNTAQEKPKQGEIDGWKPYGDWFQPSRSDFAALGYNNANAIAQALDAPVGYPGCGVDASRLALNYKDAVARYSGGATAWNRRVGNDRTRMYTRGGTMNFRAPQIGQYPPNHQTGRGDYAEGATGSGCFGTNYANRFPAANTTPPTRFPTKGNYRVHRPENRNWLEAIGGEAADFHHIGGAEGETRSSGGGGGGGGCGGPGMLELGEGEEAPRYSGYTSNNLDGDMRTQQVIQKIC